MPDADGDDTAQAWTPLGNSTPMKMIYRARGGTQGAVLAPRGYRAVNDVGAATNVAGDATLYPGGPYGGEILLATSDNTTLDAPLVTDATGIGVIRSDDILDAVRLVGTHGPTTSTDEILAWLENFQKARLLNLYGVHWLEGVFAPSGCHEMALVDEIEKLCPDMFAGKHKAIKKALADHLREYPSDFNVRWQ